MLNTNTQTQNNSLQLLKTCIHADIDRLKLRKSAWNNGIKQYMHDFIDYDFTLFVKLTNSRNYVEFEKILLNGAKDWHEYSWGGCSLCYNSDIAKRLCNPSELKKTKCGQNDPNRYECWHDVQARALYQACRKLYFVILNKRSI